ncbi:MAG: hypothetical protein ACJAXS_000460 [Colwellia sp.]|jgi:hypothetical protein
MSEKLPVKNIVSTNCPTSCWTNLNFRYLCNSLLHNLVFANGTKQPDRSFLSSSEVDSPSDNYDGLNLSRFVPHTAIGVRKVDPQNNNKTDLTFFCKKLGQLKDQGCHYGHPI